MDKETRDMFKLILEKLDQMEERMEGRMDRLEGRVDERMDRMEKRMEERMDERMDRMEKQMEDMWHEINACNMNLTAVDKLLQSNFKLDARIIQLEEWQERCRA